MNFLQDLVKCAGKKEKIKSAPFSWLFVVRIELSTGGNWIKLNTVADPGFPVGEELALQFTKSDNRKTP